MDPLDRAYAVLEVRRGCTRAQLKRAYRDLVRRWHPDRFAADPAGQAEATVKLRAINDAFRTVARALGGDTGAAPAAPAAPPAAAARRHQRDRPLSRSEIDALVDALKTPGPVDVVLDWVEVIAPMFAGVLLLWPLPRLGRPSAVQAFLGAACLALGIVLLIRQRRARQGEG